PLKEGALKSETVLPMWNDETKFAHRTGENPFGSVRGNLPDIVDHHEYKVSPEKMRLTEGVIPYVNRGINVHQGDIPSYGQLRTQTGNVDWAKLKPGMDKKSNGFISKQFKSNATTKAGSNVMDRRRNGATFMEYDKQSECFIPILFDNLGCQMKEGAEFGSFRPMYTPSTGGWPMSWDEEKKCRMAVPFQISGHLNLPKAKKSPITKTITKKPKKPVQKARKA
ncbi:unnamed protein product, partial [Mesorhabditis spiculigera]